MVKGIGAGARYGYRLDGGDARADPASRYQPDGPLALSMVVDPGRYAWRDQSWGGVPRHGQVLYELTSAASRELALGVRRRSGCRSWPRSGSPWSR
jgi:maltooligosyltrehalose trehalohydrolase